MKINQRVKINETQYGFVGATGTVKQKLDVTYAEACPERSEVSGFKDTLYLVQLDKAVYFQNGAEEVFVAFCESALDKIK